MTYKRPPRLKAFTFYDAEGGDYPFYAYTERKAVVMAIAWAKERGIKLYRRSRR